MGGGPFKSRSLSQVNFQEGVYRGREGGIAFYTLLFAQFLVKPSSLHPSTEAYSTPSNSPVVGHKVTDPHVARRDQIKPFSFFMARTIRLCLNYKLQLIFAPTQNPRQWSSFRIQLAGQKANGRLYYGGGDKLVCSECSSLYIRSLGRRRKGRPEDPPTRLL